MKIEKSAESRSAKMLLIVFGVLFFTYTVFRAYCLSITWDEAFSYMEFVRNGIILPNKYVKMSANNHLLNTALMVCFSKLFGASAFVLRIPNLLAHLIFLYFSAKLVARFQSSLLIVSSFLILNCNPYLLDFFSVARGYGLSFGLMMASLYYLYNVFTEDEKRKHALITVFFAGLALFANFALLNYFIISIGVLKLYFLFLSLKTPGTRKEKVNLFFKNCGLSLILSLIILLGVIPILIHLKLAGALFLGENSGFWQATVSPLIKQLCYLKDSNLVLEKIVKGSIVLILFMGAVVCGIKIWKKQIEKDTLFLIVIFGILFFCSFAVVIEHNYLETPYLLTRAALFLFLLFAIALVFLLNELARQKKQFVAIAAFIGFLLSVHFCYSANVGYAFEWMYDSDTKKMINDLEEIHGEKSLGEIRLGIPMIMDPDINFYKETEKLHWLTIGWSNPAADVPCDYLFLPPQKYGKEEAEGTVLIKIYSTTGNVLLKVKKAPPTPLKLP